MEALIIIFLVGLFLVSALRSSKNKPRRRLPPKTRPNTPRARKKPQPFDARSARPVPKDKVIVGPAYVIDGDSIVIRKTQIRIFGVDAPELNHPFGQKAKWAMVSLCKGKAIRAEVTEIDAHGRAVARCYLPDGRDLSAELVKHGLAIDWPKFSGGKYRRMETSDARKKLWLADARQKGRMEVWRQYEAEQKWKAKGKGQ